MPKSLNEYSAGKKKSQSSLGAATNGGLQIPTVDLASAVENIAANIRQGQIARKNAEAQQQREQAIAKLKSDLIAAKQKEALALQQQAEARALQAQRETLQAQRLQEFKMTMGSFEEAIAKTTADGSSIHVDDLKQASAKVKHSAENLAGTFAGGRQQQKQQRGYRPGSGM